MVTHGQPYGTCSRTDKLKKVEIVELVNVSQVLPLNNLPGSLTHLVVVLHDGLLPRARVHPGDEVFHVPGDEHSRVGDGLGTDSDMSLLDRANGLFIQFS